MVDALSIPVPFDDSISRNTSIYSREELSGLAYHGKSMDWLLSMQQPLIANWHSDFALMRMDNHWLPLGLGNVAEGQTYIASPHHGYIDYARDELDQIKDEKTRRWADRALRLADPWFSMMGLDRAVSVNAWGVSTHLYPEWSLDQVEVMTDVLTETYTNRPLWMRTLNEINDQRLMSHLVEAGWQLWPSRQVYIFDPKHASDWANRRNNQIDQKLLRTTPLTLVEPSQFVVDDAPVMAELYAKLYLRKHSRWNAEYLIPYFELAMQHGWLEFHGFKDQDGKLIAFIGAFSDERTMTTPMLGYETELPQNLGLYRLLMGKMKQLTLERNLVLNLGAGSANFKRMRGGQPILEWHAFYGRHLPVWKSWPMSLTGWLMSKSVPSFLAKQEV